MRGIDRFGALSRLDHSGTRDLEYLDLTRLTAAVVPSLAIDDVHEYRTILGTSRVRFNHELLPFIDADEVDDFLRSPGLHRVLFCAVLPTVGDLRLAHHGFESGSAMAARSTLRPRPFAEWLDPVPDRSAFPHSCPTCGGPAYIGLRIIECMGGCPTVGGRP